jgi:uncharacterized protein (PEP-CTERM system associated)
MRYLDSKTTPLIGNSSSSNSNGETYSITAVRADQLSSMTFGASLALSPTTTGEVNEQNNYIFSYSRKLTDKLTTNLSANYKEFKSADGEETNTKNMNILPSINYGLTEQLGLTLAYRYRMRDTANKTKVHSNAVYVSINYDWDAYRISH